MRIALILIGVVLTVVIVAGVLVGPRVWTWAQQFRPQQPMTEVRVEPAEVSTLVETIPAPGEIVPHTNVEIAAVVSARIDELPVEEGQAVRKGDLLAKLDDRDLRAQLTSAQARRDAEQFRLQSNQAQLDGLRSNLEFAERERQRIETLYETGDVSGRDLDNARERVTDLETQIETTTHAISVTESSLAAANAEIDRAKEGLANTTITSPIDGTIALLNVESGEIVTGSTTNPGTIMMTIADFNRMVLNAEVAESDIARVRVGQNATIYINAYPDETFSGTVRHIALQRSMSANGTGFFRTEVELDLQGRPIMLSGLKANVEIEIETHEGVVVPYQAIVVREIESMPEAARTSGLVDRQKTKANVVYRLVDGKAVCTPVKAGPSDRTHRLVLEGLESGDEVIIGPFKVLETIKHDDAVKPMEDPTAASGEQSEAGSESEPGADDGGGDEDELEADGEIPEDASAEATPAPRNAGRVKAA